MDRALVTTLNLFTDMASLIVLRFFVPWVWHSRRTLNDYWYCLLGVILFFAGNVFYMTIVLIQEIENLYWPEMPFFNLFVPSDVLMVWRVSMLVAAYLEIYGFISVTRYGFEMECWHRWAFQAMLCITSAFPLTYLLLRAFVYGG